MVIFHSYVAICGYLTNVPSRFWGHDRGWWCGQPSNAAPVKIQFLTGKMMVLIDTSILWYIMMYIYIYIDVLDIIHWIFWPHFFRHTLHPSVKQSFFSKIPCNHCWERHVTISHVHIPKSNPSTINWCPSDGCFCFTCQSFGTRFSDTPIWIENSGLKLIWSSAQIKVDLVNCSLQPLNIGEFCIFFSLSSCFADFKLIFIFHPSSFHLPSIFHLSSIYLPSSIFFLAPKRLGRAFMTLPWTLTTGTRDDAPVAAPSARRTEPGAAQCSETQRWWAKLGIWIWLPSGYVKIAIENDHL